MKKKKTLLNVLAKDKWVKWVALTTTIFAVCAAISSLRSSSFSTRTQLYTTKEANAWQYFQAKSIKQHNCELQRDNLLLRQHASSLSPEERNFLEGLIKNCANDIARYEAEKAEIKTQAEKLTKDQDEFKKHSGSFGLAVMLLQMAIMLSSVGAFLKIKGYWFLGLFFGIGGLLYMLNGFFLLF